MSKLAINNQMSRLSRIFCGLILGILSSETYIWLLSRRDNAQALEEAFASDKTEFLMVILILSSPNNFDHRRTIRETWLTLEPRIIEGTEYQDIIFIPREKENSFQEIENVSQQAQNIISYEKLLNSSKIPKDVDPNIKTKHFFVLGTLGLQNTTGIVDEQAKYNDLLLLDDHEDTYTELTVKLVKSLKELEGKKISYKYLLKCDDDTYTKLDFMAEALNQYDLKLEKLKQKGETLKNLQLYWGYFDGRAPIRRSGKYEEKDFNLCGQYLPYAVGGGYVLSKDLVTYIATHSDTLSQYRSEDISVGTWLSPMRNVHRWHDVRFDSWYTPRDCKHRQFVLHKRSVKDMKEIFNGNPCHAEQRKQKLYEYFYNWNGFPSQCCFHISLA